MERNGTRKRGRRAGRWGGRGNLLLDLNVFLQAMLHSGAEIRGALLPISFSELSSQSAKMILKTAVSSKCPSNMNIETAREVHLHSLLGAPVTEAQCVQNWTSTAILCRMMS